MIRFRRRAEKKVRETSRIYRKERKIVKFDKETVIVFIIAGLILAGWMYFYPRYQQEEQARQLRLEEEQKEKKAAQEAANKGGTVTPETAPVEKKAEVAAPVAEKAAEVKAGEKSAEVAAPAAEKTAEVKTEEKKTPIVQKQIVVKNDVIELTVDNLTGTIAAVRFLKHKESVGVEDQLLLEPQGKRTFTTDLEPGELAVQPTVTLSGSVLTLVRRYAGYEITQTFTLKEDSYSVGVDFVVKNISANKIEKDLTFWNMGMPPMDCISNDNSNPRQSVDYCLAKGNDVIDFTPDSSDDDEEVQEEIEDDVSKEIAWVGTSNRYFTSMLFPRGDWKFSRGLAVEQLKVETRKGGNAAETAIGGKVALVLASNEAKTFQFTYYCGPKELKRVDELPETAIESMHIAYWSWFEFISRPMARLLVWLNSWIGNYGIAIILLTLLVRGILWPVTQKANNSMRRMQKIQPQMKALREKYKDNPQEMNMRMMELYRQEKVNPLGGCLPLLLQLPIFFALYSVFDTAVELRHVSFLWAKDLAQPDLIGPTIGIFGKELGLHPLIIAMTILMVVQQKMTPSQADPMQQKMMMAMPVIMLVMLYWLPSGLTLYWTVSQICSIVQLKIGQHIAAREEAGEAIKMKK